METPEVVQLQPYGQAPVSEKPKKAWFVSKGGGFNGTPIEYAGESFFYKQLKKSDIRQFAAETRRLQREGKALEQQQEAELKALKAEAKRNDIDEKYVDLGDERIAFYDTKGEEIADALDAAYVSLLTKGIIGWSLEEKFDPALLADMGKEDKVAICQELAQRSTSGLGSAKN